MMFDFMMREYPQNGSPAGITMEGKGEAKAASSELTNLEHLQAEDASILALLRILLSVSTLPHVVTIVVLSSLLQFATVSGLEAMGAMGYVALSGGYFLTGLMSGRPTVDRWIRLAEREGDERSTLSRMLGSFRICIFPLVMSVLVFASLLALFGEQGAVADLTSVLPWVLSSCFVVWAIVQGRGFGRWLSSVSASKLPGADAREPGLSSRSTVVSFALIMCLTVVLLYGFESLVDSSTGFVNALLGNSIFLVIVSAVFALSWRRSRGARLRASSRADFHRFGGRWLFLSQLMITWHLLTVWRHQFITPSTAVLVAEEFLLMMFTVLMAIWGLTSRSFRSPLKLVNLNNALPMGLAFGYAYAGSVAMLTTVLDDIRAVMMAGHLVVAMTFLWMQPRVLDQTMGQAAAEEHIKRVVEEAVAAPEPSVLETQPASQEPQIEEAEPKDSGEASGDSVGVVGPADGGDGIGEEVEWKDPDVLANEVEWDDEIELLD